MLAKKSRKTCPRVSVKLPHALAISLLLLYFSYHRFVLSNASATKDERERERDPTQYITPIKTQVTPKTEDFCETLRGTEGVSIAYDIMCTDKCSFENGREVLFERARNAFGDTFDAIFLRVLKTVNEKRTTLNGVDVRLYAPHGDLGIKVVLQELGKNEYETDEIKFSDDDVYVDVGSNLGLVVLRLALTNPTVKILSIEAAPPTWLFQQFNLMCNLEAKQLARISSECVGLGGAKGTIQMTYRPDSTTSTRAWNPKSESKATDIELDINIATLSDLMLRTSTPFPIALMKIDCEGCEYSFVPHLSAYEFENIKMMIGEVHYGFMARAGQPPSKEQADLTHKKMCQHGQFQRIAIECCPYHSTQLELCKDYDAWLKKVDMERH